jgi:hypothetical protein
MVSSIKEDSHMNERTRAALRSAWIQQIDLWKGKTFQEWMEIRPDIAEPIVSEFEVDGKRFMSYVRLLEVTDEYVRPSIEVRWVPRNVLLNLFYYVFSSGRNWAVFCDGRRLIPGSYEEWGI